MATPGHYSTDTSDMFAIHKALLASLDAAPGYIAKAGTDPERVALISSFYDNVLAFLHVHHEGEDELVYPVLEERCVEAKPVLERIDDQHKLLYAPMDAGSAAIASWRSSPSQEGGAAVVAALVSIDDTLRPHLAEEEATVLPIAAKWLSPEEWGELPKHGMMNFRGDKPWLVLGLIREQLDQEHRDGMLAAMPPEFQVAWTEQLEPTFNAYIAEVRL